jgi:hypothetical protein
LYYGATHNEAGTKAYFLTSSTIYSNDISTSILTNVDLDFDVVLNTPRSIKGNAFVSLTLQGTKNSGAGYLKYTAYIRKYSGTTETDIANATSEEIGFNSNTDQKTLTIKIPIASVVNFKKGDTLRLSIVTALRVDSGSFSVASMFHDPMARSAPSETTTSQMRFYCPFVLNL